MTPTPQMSDTNRRKKDTTMTTASAPLVISPALKRLATVHGVEMHNALADIVVDVAETLISFDGARKARTGNRRALKTGDTALADDYAINVEALKGDNRDDQRAILKAAARATSRRERALLVVLANKGF